VGEPKTREFEQSKIKNEKNEVGENEKEAIIDRDPVKTSVVGTHSHKININSGNYTYCSTQS
jgi:hypothetical protein